MQQLSFQYQTLKNSDDEFLLPWEKQLAGVLSDCLPNTKVGQKMP
jgi:hypothetical protein